MLTGDRRVRLLMRRPYCTLERRRFGLRIIWMLLTVFASCVFPLRLHASLLRTYNRLSSLMNASCLGLRPPAAMTDGLFPPVHAVSSAGLCKAFLEHHDHAFLLRARRRRLLRACVCLPSFRRGQTSEAVPEARRTLCWAGRLPGGRLRLTRSLAIGCEGWSTSSVDETASVA